MSTTTSPRKLEQLARSKAGLFLLTPTLIQPEPGFNGRTDYGDLRTLAADIEANGLNQPLKIRKLTGTETIFIVDGHRRHAAITQILIPEGRWPSDPKDSSLPAPVECTSVRPGTKPIDLLFMQLSMNTGKNLSLLEKAQLYQRILREDPSLKPADISRRTGETKQAVSDALRLIKDGSDSLLDAITAGTLAASTAIAIIKQAGPQHPAQNDLLQRAIAAAQASGREHVMPKDIPPAGQAEDKQSPADSSHSSHSSPSEAAAFPLAAGALSDLGPSDLGPSTAEGPPPIFHLFLISDVPTDPARPDSPFYHETERLALTPPPADSAPLHLLSALTPSGPAYGYRCGDIEVLPDISNFETLGCDPDAGYRTCLELVLRRLGLTESEADAIRTAFHDALCRYFPEQGEAEEPEELAFIAPPVTDSPADPDAVERIKSSPSTNRDGSTPGAGNSGGFVAPDKRLAQADQILEAIAEKGNGNPDRIETAELLLSFIRAESSPAALKSHLTTPTGEKVKG